MTGPQSARLPQAGQLVVVMGAGVSGSAVVRQLLATGCRVLLSADGPAPDLPADLAGRPGITAVGDLPAPPDAASMVITSPGFRPDHRVLVQARHRGLEVIGEVELAWRLDSSDRARDWLVVTGTNGKTTTVGMLESILTAAGVRATACGNVGWPALSAVVSEPRQGVIAAELSSFQLHYAPSVHPSAGLVLNVNEDHLDWYDGSMAAYAQDKARALTGEIAAAVVDDRLAAALLTASPAAKQVPITAGDPAAGGLGLRNGMLLDDAFGCGPLVPAAEIRPAGLHNVTNALGAATLALAVGVAGDAVAQGLRAFRPGAHRNVIVARRAGVTYVDDSKATNPHAAMASLAAYSRVVWIAGGQLKGASVEELVTAVADRLSGVVLLGIDAPIIDAALSRHAPDVPRMRVLATHDGAMTDVVRQAATMASPGDVVLLAPAAASLDMFTSYAARGAAFAAAIKALPDSP